MKSAIILLSFVLVCVLIGKSQSKHDSILTKKTFGSYQYYQGNVRVELNDLLFILKPNKQAYKEINTAYKMYTLSCVVGGAGGILVGMPLGLSAAGGKLNWKLVGFGAGVMLFAIPISRKQYKHMNLAVDIFNSGSSTSSLKKNTELNWIFTPHGFGVNLRF